MHNAVEPCSGRCDVLVLGDSHADVFKQECLTSRFVDHTFTVVSVAGATVSGLENPNSATQAMPVFRSSLQASQAHIVIVLIGEVDVGFVLWVRSEKYGLALPEMLAQALQKYQDWLRELRARYRVICISAPLPTICDSNDWAEVANQRKEVKATQVERTQLTLRFNSAMQVFCQGQAIEYIMLDCESLGGDGVVSGHLLSENPLDHHYRLTVYADMLAEKLNPILGASGHAQNATQATPHFVPEERSS